jgi:hypothetical protein
MPDIDKKETDIWKICEPSLRGRECMSEKIGYKLWPYYEKFLVQNHVSRAPSPSDNWGHNAF